MTFRFAEEAVAEAGAARDFYNAQVPGLGDAFVEEIDRGIQKVILDPERFRIVRDDIRRCLIKRFPYGLYYSIEPENIVIWAVMHLHRYPDYWEDRRK